MRGLKEIVKAYDEAVAIGRSAALATLVHVEGSSYRRPGARMLVDDEGNLTGAISGGCLEGDALRKALLAIAKQESKLVTYDTSNEADQSIGIQLGCEGIIQVLFEPIDASIKNNPIEIIRSAVLLEACVIQTIFDLNHQTDKQVGTNAVFAKDVAIPIIQSNAIQINTLKDDVNDTFQKASSQFIEYQSGEKTFHAFYEFLSSPIQLVIVGAGYDAIPLSKMANILGWTPIVIDGRDAYVKPERFEASCQVFLMRPEQLLETIKIDHRTAFVLVTHNYNYDKAILKALLPLDIQYIGMLGPKKKLNRMIDDLKTDGITITDLMMKKVFGPTGLEIGAETPDEIALSILAEIQAVFQGKQGYSLRSMGETIHNRERNNFLQKKL
jgi:xanthine/CO dehydrogenase XdhC/CoxF family maturation factor